MKKLKHNIARFQQDQSGQALIEYLVLMIASVVAGFIVMISLKQVIVALYSLTETEVAKPNHF